MNGGAVGRIAGKQNHRGEPGKGGVPSIYGGGAERDAGSPAGCSRHVVRVNSPASANKELELLPEIKPSEEHPVGRTRSTAGIDEHPNRLPGTDPPFQARKVEKSVVMLRADASEQQRAADDR